jgi:hypothetical protein
LRNATWWTGLLFAIGSVCFMIGPFPGFIDLVGAGLDGVVFFVGSLFFTSAAFIQLRHSAKGQERTASMIQFVGTLFFNINTFRAMQDSYDKEDVNRLIWTPDAIGSACFLVSGAIAYVAVRHLRHEDRMDWRIAAVNLAGCVLFGISAIASYVVPETGDALDLAAANWTTSLGALCFLIGALMLIGTARAKPVDGRVPETG